MNEDGVCISTVDSPVFVCERCGSIMRVLYYKPDDELQCKYCGSLMTKTSYILSDDEGYFMYGNSSEAHEFQDNIFKQYIKDSSKYDFKTFDERTNKLKKNRR